MDSILLTCFFFNDTATTKIYTYGNTLSLHDALPFSPDAAIAVEVRDPEWLMPAFTSTLRAAGATYCLGLHAKMPPIDEQLPILRALWPGPLVCRWNLHRRQRAYGYEAAKTPYGAFNAPLALGSASGRERVWPIV